MMITTLQEKTAPWTDWSVEIETKDTECPHCNGYGRIFTARDIYTGEEVRVKFSTYCMLTETTEDCEALGQRWQAWDDVPCSECDGEGYI